MDLLEYQGMETMLLIRLHCWSLWELHRVAGSSTLFRLFVESSNEGPLQDHVLWTVFFLIKSQMGSLGRRVLFYPIRIHIIAIQMGDWNFLLLWCNLLVRFIIGPVYWASPLLVCLLSSLIGPACHLFISNCDPCVGWILVV